MVFLVSKGAGQRQENIYGCKMHYYLQKNRTVTAAGILSSAYLMFILPPHATSALWLFIMHIHPAYGLPPQRLPLVMLSWVLLLCAILLTCHCIVMQRKNLKAFTVFFKASHLNIPLRKHVVMHRTGRSYLGFDAQKGTLIFIIHPDTTLLNFFFPRDILVAGFDVHDWKSVAVEGNKLTVYTGNPALPSVSLVSRQAAALYETMNFMRQYKWTYGYNVRACVEDQARTIADAYGLNLVLTPQ